MVESILWAVGLEPTNACNLRCKVCWSQNPHLYPLRPRGFMSWSLFTKVVDELAAYREKSGRPMKLCMNYGGESMLHPRYKDMVRYASRKGCFDLRAITNAVKLTPEIADVLVDCDVHVTVSIHNTPKSHSAHYKTYSLLTDRGIPLDGSIVREEYTDEQVAVELKRWTEIVEEVRVYPAKTEDNHYINYKVDDPPPCTQPSYYMGILWNGDVYPCCHLLSTDFRGMGNVAETSVEQVWNGERYRLMRNHQLEDAPCKGCEFW